MCRERSITLYRITQSIILHSIYIKQLFSVRFKHVPNAMHHVANITKNSKSFNVIKQNKQVMIERQQISQTVSCSAQIREALSFRNG